MMWIIFGFTLIGVVLNLFAAILFKSPDDEKYIHSVAGAFQGAILYWSASVLFGGG